MGLDTKTLLIGGAAVAGVVWYVSRQQAAAEAAAAAAAATSAQSPSRWDQFTGGLTGALAGGKGLFDSITQLANTLNPPKKPDEKPKMLPKEQDPWGHLLRTSANTDALGIRKAAGRVLAATSNNSTYAFARAQTLGA